jgi:hypothetical protein
MQERIKGLVLLRGPWVRPCGTGTTAACAQHEPTTFPLHISFAQVNQRRVLLNLDSRI